MRHIFEKGLLPESENRWVNYNLIVNNMEKSVVVEINSITDKEFDKPDTDGIIK